MDTNTIAIVMALLSVAISVNTIRLNIQIRRTNQERAIWKANKEAQLEKARIASRGKQ